MTLEEPEAPWRKEEEEEGEQGGEQAASCFPSLRWGPQPGGRAGAGGIRRTFQPIRD